MLLTTMYNILPRWPFFVRSYFREIAMEGIWCILVFLRLSVLAAPCCTVGIVLESSLGGRAACPGETVVFECQVKQAGRLTWRIAPPANNTILLDLSKHGSFTGQDISGLYSAIVTNYSRNPQVQFLGDISSNLSVVASPESVRGLKMITCSDGITAPIPSLLLVLANYPSSPQNLTYIIISYGINNYRVRIQWKPPSSDDGVPIHSYSFAVNRVGKQSGGGNLTSNRSIILALQYNYNYIFEISAENCNGRGELAFLNITGAVSCALPSSPANGSIEAYNSTQVGTEIQFHCDEGFIPTEWRTAQCQQNGTWTPEPTLLNCSVVSCAPPFPPANGSIEAYNSTQVGIKVQFHCDEGYIPTEWKTAQCQRNGTWTQKPSVLNCTVVDCGHPSTRLDLTLTSTTYNSTVSYICEAGVLPPAAGYSVCTGRGEWEPDPSTVECREKETIYCGSPNPPSNTIMVFNDTNEHSSLTVHCNDSYYLVNPENYESRCTANGSWIPDLTTFICAEASADTVSESMQDWATAVIVAAALIVGLGIGSIIVIFILFAQKRRKEMPKGIEENDYSVSEQSAPGVYSQVQAVQELNRNLPRSIETKFSPTIDSSALLTYAELGPHLSNHVYPAPSSDDTAVQYATIWHGAIVDPLPSDHLHNADKSVNLDQLLIQLKEVEPHWMGLGQAVGIDEKALESIQSQMSSDAEAMIEVVDRWLAKIYPQKPTWREVADIVEQIGHKLLARSLKQVYVTGFLPIEVSNRMPSLPGLEEAINPPLPPKRNTGRGTPSRQTSNCPVEQPPPLPPKQSCSIPRSNV